MKCFRCGFKAITKYWYDYDKKYEWRPQFHPNCPCTAVTKKCNMCGWESKPVKVPVPRRDL